MGLVQQAVLEFDEEVRAPWRPRLVSGTGAELPAVRPPSRRTPSRVGSCAAPDRSARPAGQGSVVVGHAPSVVTPANRAARGRGGSSTLARRTRLRLTRRARRLAFVLAVAGGVALGLWLAPLLGSEGDLRLAGESSVVVQEGDTLWSIATSVAGADDDVRAVVDEIQRRNGLHGSDLVPGQVLDLP